MGRAKQLRLWDTEEKGTKDLWLRKEDKNYNFVSFIKNFYEKEILDESDKKIKWYGGGQAKG